MFVTRCEKWLAGIAAIAIALSAVLLVRKAVSVESGGLVFLAICGALMLAIGLVYRITGRSLAIGTVAIGIALLLVVTAALATLNLLLLPLSGGTHDDALVRMDALIGFDWREAMEFAARYPLACEILRYVYQSTSIQLVVLLLVLGFSGRQAEFDRLLLCYTFAAIGVVAWWTLWPSLGTMAYYELPQAVVAAVNPVVDPAYGALLRKVSEVGVTVIDPVRTLGLVAFPSFHTVLALLAIVSAASVRWLFPPMLVLNLLMLPAVVIHGGHHLFDLIGGAVAFLLAMALTDAVLLRGAAPRARRELAARVS
ncbi:phosphatase PAP2 family protein [Fulvimarina endophytica]|nr:phosphatase PAP2 family protein [Fulvimarina endophytica]